MNNNLQAQVQQMIGELDNPTAPLETTIGYYTLPDRDRSFVTKRRMRPITGTSSKVCSSASVSNLYGASTTNTEGIATVRMSRFFCGDSATIIDVPAYFVITPKGSAPVHLTFTLQKETDSNPANEDIVATVFSWQINGTPAPRVQFDWHCCLSSQPAFE